MLLPTENNPIFLDFKFINFPGFEIFSSFTRSQTL